MKRSSEVLLLNPPRRGCTPEVLQATMALEPGRILYVSCSPRSLARDLAFLAARGYRTQWVVPVDLFVHTEHVECVALLHRHP